MTCTINNLDCDANQKCQHEHKKRFVKKWFLGGWYTFADAQAQALAAHDWQRAYAGTNEYVYSNICFPVAWHDKFAIRQEFGLINVWKWNRK